MGTVEAYKPARQDPIRLILVDGRENRLGNLAAKLAAANTLQLIGQAINDEEALQLCHIIAPEVVLINLEAPDLDGMEVVREVKLRWANMTVLVLVEGEHEELLRSALEAGADGYLPHNADPGLLASAIQHVVEGRRNNQQASQKAAASSIDLFSQADFNPATRRTAELAEAARIQTSLLPPAPPAIKGWDIAVKMLPARETSGDFYDFMILDNDKLGIVIADVSDKGLGAALFMAMASTLFRTFLVRHPGLPALAIGTVNERILHDSGGSSFVTAFVGILEPDTGRLRYVNAGHVPSILISAQKSKAVDLLKRTGIALGVLPNETWKQKMAKLIPGDLLLFYTDGVIEAQNRRGEFYGSERLLDLARSQAGAPAQRVVDVILADLSRFMDDAPRSDDVVLIALVRR